MTKPILRDVPAAFETERLHIRAPRAGDGAAVNAAILQSLEELKPWMPWAHPAPTAEDSEAFAREAHAKFLTREDLLYSLWLKGSGEFVGSSGLHRIDWSVPKFEIGYWCATGHAGKGYVSEAVRGLTRLAFEMLGAQRVEIRCDAKNDRSRRVIERCNFVREGCLRHQTRQDESLRDTLVFSMLPREFEALALSWPPIQVVAH